jgi:hypothetical protein
MGGANKKKKKMSTICRSSSSAAGDPSSTAVRPKFERLQVVATAGPFFCFLILNTLHVTMIPRPVIQYSHMILLYCASLLFGGLLSDSDFNSWNLFLATVVISSVLTAILYILSLVTTLSLVYVLGG